MQAFDGTVAEHPHTNVHKEEVCRSETAERFGRWLLQHVVELARRAAVHEENAVVAG